MPNLEDYIKECCDAVDSNKITERKKRVPELKAYVTRDDVRELLNLNTKNSKPFKWDYILLASHRGVQKESERLHADELKGKPCSGFDVSKANVSDLILSVVRSANSGGYERLSCKILTECVFNVLEDPNLKKHFGINYINLLYEQILSSHKYCTEISSDFWHDCFERVIQFYEEQTEGPEKCDIARCLEQIVCKGCSQSYLALAVKKRFPFMISEIKSLINSSMGLKENILQLALTVCKQLFKECRMLICKFGEDIMDEIIHLYEFRAGAAERKQAILLDFLLLQIQAHHPNGVTEESKGAYAYNWENWKRHLRCLYRLISGEVKQICRKSKISNEYSVSSNIVALSVEICKLVFEDTSCSVLELSNISILNDSTASSAPKRCRLETGVPAVLRQLLTATNSLEVWPLLCLLAALLSKYPKLIGESDFEQLLQYLSDQLLKCKEPAYLKYLCICCISLLKVETQLNPVLLDVRTTSRLWGNVWETLLRSLNMCEEDCHALLQDLILSRKKLPISALLQMYLSGAVPLSNHSLYTLSMITQYWCIIDLVGVQGCISLLNWVFPCSKQDITAIEINNKALYFSLIPRVALSLTLKCCAPQDTKEDATYSDSDEDHLLLSSFDKGLLIHPKSSSNLKNSQVTGVFQVDEKLFKELHTLVYRDSHDLLKYAANKTNISFTRLVYQCSILLQISTKLFFWKLPTDQGMIDLLSNTTVQMMTTAIHILENEQEVRVLNNVLKQLEMLWYQTSQNSLDFNSIVLFRSPVEKLLKACLSLAAKNYLAVKDSGCREDDINFNRITAGSSPLDPDAITGYESIKLQATKTLVQYCCNPVNDVDSNVRYNLLVNLLKLPDLEDDINPSLRLQMAIAITNGALRSNEVDFDLLYQILLCIRNLSRQWHASSLVSLVLFDILKDCIEHVHRLEDQQFYPMILTFVKAFSKFVKDRKYGAKVSAKFVDLLGHFAVVDPEATWAKWDSGTEVPGQNINYELTPVSHEVLSYLSNPFYEVRISAAKVIPNVFATNPSSKLNFDQNDLAFKNLLTFVSDGFMVEGELITDEEIDESVTRTTSALHSIAAIISTKCHWRRKALSALFHFTVMKGLNLDLVKKVLKLIGRNLNVDNVLGFLESNLTFIISNWLGQYGYSDLNRFPWSLFDASSQNGFMLKYASYIVPVLIYNTKSELFENMANRLKTSSSNLIKDCYPNLIGGVLTIVSDPSQEHTGEYILDTVQTYIGSDALKELMSRHLPEVIVSIIRKQYDPEQMKILCGSSDFILPDPDPVNFKTDIIINAIKYLQASSPKPEIPLMEYLSREIPGHTQKILLRLYMDIHLATTPEFRLSCLQNYLTLCDLLSVNLNPRKLKLCDFIIHFIMNTLLHLVSGELALPVLAFMNHFITAVLPACASEINLLLPVLVATLIPTAEQETHLGRRALVILNNLFINYSPILPGIALLDPLPQVPVFTDMSSKYREMRYKEQCDYQLQNEIRHFIKVDILEHLCTYRVEGLRSLKIQLSENKSDLSDLYKELENLRGFSEDCAESILHRLICVLVNLMSSEDPNVQMEAARCLGELGPGNLTTLVLKPDLKHSTTSDLLDLLCYSALELARFLVDDDITVMQEASIALYTLFSSTQQQAIIGELKKFDERKVLLLHPFILSSKRNKKIVQNGIQDDSHLQLVAEYFCPDFVCSYTEWITRLVCALLDFCDLKYLIPVCKIKVIYAQELFPYIISVLLQKYKSSEKMIIAEVNKFFSITSDQILRFSQTDNLEEIYCNRASVQSMLKVVNTIRLHNKDLSKPVNLNYLHIAKAAQFCSAYFTSIMYTHLWCYTNFSESSDCHREGCSEIDWICKRSEENGILVQKLLREAYLKIGEPDAVYGCGNSHVFDPMLRIKNYESERKWTRVIESYDIQLSLKPQDCQDLRNALHHSGLHYLASFVGTSTSCEDYESGWRLSRWDLAEGKGSIEDSYNSLLYIALRASHNCDKQKALATIDIARQQIIASLKHASLEAANNIYPALAQLLALQELQDFGDRELTETLNKWKDQEKIGWTEFIYAEPVLAQRIVLLKSKGDSSENCIDVFLRAAEIARMDLSFAISERWLYEASVFPHLTDISSFTLQLQETFVHWDNGETFVARNQLCTLLGKLNDAMLSKIHSKALRTYGTWMASTKFENARQIINDYFKKAIKTANESDFENKLAAVASLAQFADSEFRVLLKYVQSSQYSRKVESITQFKNHVSEMEDQVKKSTSNSDVRKSYILQKRQHEIDLKEVETTQKELDGYLTLATEYYLKSLVFGDFDDLKVFRVISLWLENNNNISLHKVVKCYLIKVPTYKILPVLPQLIAHMSEPVDPFSSLLRSLIERCANDHPHHVLPLILALSNSFKDNEYQAAPANVKKNTLEPRVVAAQQLISALESKGLGTLLRSMQLLSEAYISLANCVRPDNNSKATEYKIPKHQPILKLINLEHVLCPIISLHVNKFGKYENIIGIHKHDDSFQYVGGVNAPKKILCIGTDGIKRPMLVKGNDDLRQDAVMQQVFTIMNTLLRKNKETQRRKLVMRTYKVVPLSQRSGVIEWCTNTIPLSIYLIGNDKTLGAHSKYRPKDWNHIECRRKLSDAGRKPQEEKREVFDEICDNFKPVFRYFFLEKFHSPGIWFERQLAYTHSVATSSMIGYILGLGDRHVMNILVDENTAEVIHIDFGIAFEQGHILPTPETVPFRLTRDIIDGMGISGSYGVFHRSCEKTMHVLRECQDTILTILSVLLYDPLYMWTITPEKAQRKQLEKGNVIERNEIDSPPVEVNKLAERALARLRHKLQGREDGSTSSIEGQVCRLIREAVNPENLCRLFHGWQAHV